MKKKSLYIYYIILLLFCPVMQASALSEAQEAMISDHCATVREDLKKVQRSDARARIYLGGKFELILNKYIVPLNVRLVENNMSTANLIESQNTITAMKTKFADDYVSYQQSLEELVLADCKNEPKDFYDRIVKVRQKRQKVSDDVQSIRKELDKYMGLVTKLKEGLHVEKK